MIPKFRVDKNVDSSSTKFDKFTLFSHKIYEKFVLHRFLQKPMYRTYTFDKTTDVLQNWNESFVQP